MMPYIILVKESSNNYPGALLGFRRWSFDIANDLLVSCIDNIPWQPGLNHASGCSHPSPGRNCHCGFNAWFSVRDAQNNYSFSTTIVGAIAGAGTLELHASGFRAEQAQILALLVEKKQVSSLKKISEKYNIPIFTEEGEFLAFIHNQKVMLSFQSVEEIQQEKPRINL